MTSIDKKIYENTINLLFDLIKNLDIDPIIPTITSWAGKNRILPPGSSECPGKWDAAFSSYCIEIQENLHPDNDIRITSLLKSVQSMGTTAAENAIGHSIKYGLHNILFVISDINLAKIRSTYTIDTLIDRSGLADCIKPVTIRKGQRKSGDRILYKELLGGRRFMMSSYTSLAVLDSLSWDLIIMDEIDKAPPSIKGIGDPEGIIEARGKTINNLKVLKLSTSSNASTSRIYKAFLTGDQREYMAPCPRCGGFQHLEFMKEGKTWGLYGDLEYTKTNKVLLVDGTERYKCKLCGGDFFEKERESFMLEKSLGGLAHWEPKAQAQDARDRSYHISAMMSPMIKWKNIITDYLKTDYGKRTREYKNFVIMNEGLPYFSNRHNKPWQELKNRAEKYELGVVPSGGLILTGGVDVQKERLECQVVAWGEGLEAWSIDHRIFYGKTGDKNSVCWEQLKEFAEKKYKIEGLEYGISVKKFAIDTGYNPTATSDDERLRVESNAVYAFCAENSRFIPIKGIRESAVSDLIIKKRHKTYGVEFYLVDVSAIKDEIMENIDKTDGRRAIHFSEKYDDEFFRQFLSEIVMENEETGAVGYQKIYKNNETFDTFIYARAVMSILPQGSNKKCADWSMTEWEDYKNNLFD